MENHRRKTTALKGATLVRYDYAASVLDTIVESPVTPNERRFKFKYDDLGCRTEMELPNGVVTTYGYHRTLGALVSERRADGGLGAGCGTRSVA